VQSINEILQTIARQRGRGDALPLLASLPFEAARGERIAHLPIDSELAQACRDLELPDADAQP